MLKGVRGVIIKSKACGGKPAMIPTSQHEDSSAIPSRPKSELVLMQQCSLVSSALRSRFIADHLYNLVHYLQRGDFTVVVAVDNPAGTLSVVRKHWLGYIPKLQNRQAATLLQSVREQLAREIELLEAIHFCVGRPEKGADGVYFVLLK